MTVKQVAKRFEVSIWCIYDLRLGRTHKRIRADAGDGYQSSSSSDERSSSASP
jgi:hypothetical protein